MNDDDFAEFHELAMIGGMGSINTLREYDKPLTGKNKIYRRPIGFITNLDDLIEAE